MGCAAVISSLPSPLTALLPPNNTSLSLSLSWCVEQNNDGVAEDPNLLLNPTTPCYTKHQISGWQYQQSPPTVQCMVEKALTQATDLKELCLVAASRTDTGVQVPQFGTPFSYDSLDNIHAALNGLPPGDIRVRKISPALPEFHARFSVKSKAAKHFVGKHDFSAFANASNDERTPNPVKHIFYFDVIEMGSLLQVEIEDSGFQYRNMVALLIQIGREALPADVVP